MNRKDLQRLAAVRLKEARVLLENGCPAGAYYLGGYAVESALKACIARQIPRHEFPDKEFAQKVFTHDLKSLARIAGKQVMDDLARDAATKASWDIVVAWSPRSRYEARTTTEAQQLVSSIAHRRYGVLGCLRKNW